MREECIDLKRARHTIDFEAVRRVPITAVLDRLGILSDLRRVGRQLAGPCPIHKGTNRRQFTVNPNTNVWFCFGDCRAGGSTIELVAALEGVALRDAARLIGEWFAMHPMDARTLTVSNERRKTMSGSPSHKCFAVEDRGDEDSTDKSWWTRCGSAWPHKDGKGLNIVLTALPINARLVLREFDPEEAKQEEQKKVAKRR